MLSSSLLFFFCLSTLHVYNLSCQKNARNNNLLLFLMLSILAQQQQLFQPKLLMSSVSAQQQQLFPPKKGYLAKSSCCLLQFFAHPHFPKANVTIKPRLLFSMSSVFACWQQLFSPKKWQLTKLSSCLLVLDCQTFTVVDDISCNKKKCNKQRLLFSMTSTFWLTTVGM